MRLHEFVAPSEMRSLIRLATSAREAWVIPTPQQETAPPLDRRSHSAPDISLSTALHDAYDATPVPVGHYTIRAIFALQGVPRADNSLASLRSQASVCRAQSHVPVTTISPALDLSFLSRRGRRRRGARESYKRSANSQNEKLTADSAVRSELAHCEPHQAGDDSRFPNSFGV